MILQIRKALVGVGHLTLCAFRPRRNTETEKWIKMVNRGRLTAGTLEMP